MSHIVLELSPEHRERLTRLSARDLRTISKQARLCFQVGLAVLEKQKAADKIDEVDLPNRVADAESLTTLPSWMEPLTPAWMAES